MLRSAVRVPLVLSLCVAHAAADDTRGDARGDTRGDARGGTASDPYSARAVAARPGMAATHGEDPTASGTSLDLTERVSLPRSLGGVVREAPGTRVLSSGGVGAFSSLSLRGADGEETQVLLDEIPLTTADGGAFDLSLFPAELFARVDVFRGGSPVWLGSGAIGGVVRLVPLREKRDTARASLGAGSFGAYQLQGGAAVGSEETLSVRSHVVVRGAQNDYPYNDDRGTLLDPSDDITQRRKNEQLTDASGLFELTSTVRGGKLHVLALGHERTGGYPGPGSAPTPNIHRSRQRGLLGLSYERRAGGGAHSPRRRIQLVGSGSFNRDQYTDLYGELGVSRRWDTLDHAYRGFLRFAGSLRLTRWLESTLVSSYAIDRYNWKNRFAFPDPAPSTRHTAAAALELVARGKLLGVGVELRPSARVEWSHTRLDADQGVSGAFDPTASVLLPSARLGLGVSPVDDLALTASVATGGRLPTMFELFGDRGMTLPAPGLKPVNALSFDGGATWCTSGEIFRSSLEVHGFLQRRTDMIAASMNAQKQARYANLSEVEQKGVEFGAFASLFDHVSVHGSATYLHTETQLEKRLPLRPTWVMFARPELSTRITRGPVSSAASAVEFSHRSFVFADPANLVPMGECSTLALSLAVGFWRDRLRLVGRMDDVADVRCTDLLGYPLPGRSLFFSLSYQEEKS